MYKTLNDEVVDGIGDRIIATKVERGEVTMNIVSTYALQVGLEEEIKAICWKDLEWA